MWGSIAQKLLPQDFKIPVSNGTVNTVFVGNTVKNGVHAQEWRFPLKLLMYTHDDQAEYEFFEMTVFVSRFDKTLVQVEIEPTPFGVSKLQLKTFNLKPIVTEADANAQYKIPSVCY